MEDDPTPRPRVAAKAAANSARTPRFSTPRVIAVRRDRGAWFWARSLYAFHRLEQFLIRDPRFALNGADGAGYSDARDSRRGARFAPRDRRRFSPTIRAQRLPDAARRPPRRTLRTVDWVKDASVARLWPNRVMVRVEERTPVAFVDARAPRASG